MLGGVEYLGVDDEGLHIRVDGSEQTLPVDHVVICAGQEPSSRSPMPLRRLGYRVHVIGGADVAAELDAKRAIAQAADWPRRCEHGADLNCESLLRQAFSCLW